MKERLSSPLLIDSGRRVFGHSHRNSNPLKEGMFVEEEALKKGMEAKSKESVEKGAEIYMRVSASENSMF